MRNLLRLEFFFNRKWLIWVFFIFTGYFAWAVYQMSSPKAVLVTISGMLGLVVSMGFQVREDKFKTAALICSLPLRRSDIVLGKFAATWTVLIVGFIYTLGLIAALPFSKISVGELLTLKFILISLALISFIFGLLMPFTIRFGMVGIIIFLVGAQVLGILLLIITRIFGTRRNFLSVIIEGIEGFLRFILNHEADPAFLAFVAASIFVLNGASFILARFLYARRNI
jgi:hypothetical protein